MQQAKRPKVVMYFTYADRIGGPLTYLNMLMASPLKQDYDFDTCFQNKAPKGLNLPLLREMTARLKELKPDILHIHGVQSEGLYGAIAGRLAGCKHIVMTVHGMAMDATNCRGVKRFLYRYLVEPLALRLSHRVYCVCDFAAQRPVIRRNAGRGKRNCGYIYNCAAPHKPSVTREQMRQQLGVGENEILFCISGRVSRDKGFDLLADALHLLAQKQLPAWKFMVIGDGAYRPDFEQAVQPLLEQGRVIMAGQTDRVADYLEAADGFVFPSYHENLSIALLEACTAGLSCIVSNVGGNPEIIQNSVNGIVLKEQTPGAYAAAMERLLRDPETMKIYQAQAQQDVIVRFSREKMLERIRKVYDGCITKSQCTENGIN